MSQMKAQPRSDVVFLFKRKGEATTRRGYSSETVDHASWVVTLHSPQEQDCSGKTLEEALAWCLVWLMAKGTPGDWGHELGVGPFRA